jgi:hypothetical protein
MWTHTCAPTLLDICFYWGGLIFYKIFEAYNNIIYYNINYKLNGLSILLVNIVSNTQMLVFNMCLL